MKRKGPPWSFPREAPPIPDDPRASAARAAEIGTCRTARVMKKLSPMQAGARKLARLYGDALVCVRYRHDERGDYRYTTVELVVERLPLVRRSDMGRLVNVRIGFQEAQLHELAQVQGATWDDRTCLWRMPLGLAKKLGLLHRVVQTTHL